jgi:hypothetical protein
MHIGVQMRNLIVVVLRENGTSGASYAFGSQDMRGTLHRSRKLTRVCILKSDLHSVKRISNENVGSPSKESTHIIT